MADIPVPIALSTASMLRIGYYAAYLILAVRALEERGDAMSPKTFLSNLPIDSPVLSSHDTPDSKSTKNTTQMLQIHTSRYAHSVLETFMEMPPFLMDSIPTYLCLVIGYSALILAHYDESISKVSPQVSLGLISRLEDWCMRTPSKSWAIMFATLARQKVESRTGTSRSHRDEKKSSSREHERRHWQPTDLPMPTFHVGAEHALSSSSVSDSRQYEGEDFVTNSDVFPLAPEPMHSGYELAQPVMPSMEDFFGGGFCKQFPEIPIAVCLIVLPELSWNNG